MKKVILSAALISICVVSKAQSDYSNTDFLDKYKGDVKIPGKVAKSFKANPTFINDYVIIQSTSMKGRSQAGVMQKQGVGNVYSEASLAGVSEQALRNLTDELYADFVKELAAAGFNITDGESIMSGEQAAKDKEKSNNVIVKSDGSPYKEELGMMNQEGSDVKERFHFRPNGKNIYITTKAIPGTFYMKLAKKENVNLININYKIKFADFEGSKTMSKNTLTTSAGLTITPTLNITDPKGMYGWVLFGKPIEGNNDWSKGLVKTDNRDGSYWGLASSADYAIEADEAKYIAELKALLMAVQKDMVAALKEEMN